MATKIDKEACREAYNQVRDDATDIIWAAFHYEGSRIVPAGQGADYEDFKNLCTGKEQVFFNKCYPMCCVLCNVWLKHLSLLMTGLECVVCLWMG
uniref:ADF-H domain-containing protein n=1 Tax=Anabas testudineus TaxID=64144 RepID=A0AAQ6ISB5_ANATE